MMVVTAPTVINRTPDWEIRRRILSWACTTCMTQISKSKHLQTSMWLHGNLLLGSNLKYSARILDTRELDRKKILDKTLQDD